MGKAIQQTQREVTHEAEENPVSPDVLWVKEDPPVALRNRDFSYQLFRTPSDCIAVSMPIKFAD
jgi:hypothetical protein